MRSDSDRFPHGFQGLRNRHETRYIHYTYSNNAPGQQTIENNGRTLYYYPHFVYCFYFRPKGSPFRAVLSQAVLKMQETNRFIILKKKWWTEMRGGGACKVSRAEI